MEKIIDHVEQALKRLLKQFQNKPRLKALVESLIEGFQEIEDAMWELYNLNYRESNGITLDNFGKILGVEREGLADEQYIQIMTATICENISEGTIEDLIQIFRHLTNPKKVFLFEPDIYSVYLIAQNPNPLSKPTQVLKALKSSKIAGVKLQASYILDSPFLFSESEIIKPYGFGMEEIPNSGGHFTYELE